MSHGISSHRRLCFFHANLESLHAHCLLGYHCSLLSFAVGRIQGLVVRGLHLGGPARALALLAYLLLLKASPSLLPLPGTLPCFSMCFQAEFTAANSLTSFNLLGQRHPKFAVVPEDRGPHEAPSRDPSEATATSSRPRRRRRRRRRRCCRRQGRLLGGALARRAGRLPGGASARRARHLPRGLPRGRRQGSLPGGGAGLGVICPF
mmetsp:Transcript_156026/g.500347  ORF Transcript_156026/g.500347 Transcript_156026/m.500347 type:complete len:206 (+) Transcript_156026:2224-2841(+)